ncbi:MAG TPA: hypothetical protein VLB85_04255 [Acidimicrobiia bacterium]|nr:hypothetical protein [Acidimicrobiia bacterium]
MRQDSLTIRGSRLISSRRRPAATDARRVCGDASCETILSRYNQHDMCHRHRPVTFPRVRGVVAGS